MKRPSVRLAIITVLIISAPFLMAYSVTKYGEYMEMRKIENAVREWKVKSEACDQKYKPTWPAEKSKFLKDHGFPERVVGGAGFSYSEKYQQCIGRLQYHTNRDLFWFIILADSKEVLYPLVGLINDGDQFYDKLDEIEAGDNPLLQRAKKKERELRRMYQPEY